MTDPTLWLEIVAEAARLAGRTALGYFKTGLAVETKSDGSPVTRADREAERLVRAWVEERFPNDEIVGEEFGSSGDASSGRRWLIDPIDGTKSFVAGVPLWGSLVAVLEGESVLAGAINCAAADEIVVAARGAGCWHNGSRCAVSNVSALAEATVLTTDDRYLENPERRARWSYLAERSRIVRTWGDCYGYLLVATGRAEAMIDGRMSPWDAAALVPVITEAGGVFTDWRGQVTAFGGDSIATNAEVAAEVRAILEEDPR